MYILCEHVLTISKNIYVAAFLAKFSSHNSFGQCFGFLVKTMVIATFA